MTDQARADLDDAADMLQAAILTNKASTSVHRLYTAVTSCRRTLADRPQVWEAQRARQLLQRAEQATQHRREHAKPAESHAAGRTGAAGSAVYPETGRDR